MNEHSNLHSFFVLFKLEKFLKEFIEGKKYMAKSVHRVPYLRVQIMILKQWLEECFDSIPIKIVWFFLQITLLIIPYTWDFNQVFF